MTHYTLWAIQIQEIGDIAIKQCQKKDVASFKMTMHHEWHGDSSFYRDCLLKKGF